QLGKGEPAAVLAFSPDGRKLAAGLHTGSIHLWRVDDGSDLHLLDGHTSTVYGLAFSANGRILASGSYDRTVRLWEVMKGLPVQTWKGRPGAVESVCVGRTGRNVVSAASDTSLLLWDVPGWGREGKPPVVELQEPALNTLWNELALNDNVRGNRALWTMT